MTYVAFEQGFAHLGEHLRGSVVTPDDDRWDEARGAWNLIADLQPAAVVLAESAEDVAAVVRFARSEGYRVAPQATGHNATPLERLERTILLKTSRMRAVEIDPVGLVARVESGAIWEDVVQPASAVGLTALHGSSPDVGVAGYSLGGGIGWQVRSRGLATNSIRAVELVTADGELIRADATTEPELFWGLRGGSGNFGIVTSFDFQLFPLKTVYAGWLMWPWEESETVLGRWAEWIEGVPDELTSVGRILQLPELELIPEPLRGRKLAVVEIAYLGDEAEGAALVAPLRELRPELDTVATVPAASLARLHQDPEGATPAFVEHALLERLPAEAVEAVVAAVGPGSGSPILSTEIRHLGGVAATPAPGAGVMSHVAGKFLTAAIGVPFDDAMAEAIHRHFAVYADAVAPYAGARRYLNFIESATDTSVGYAPDAYRRLRALKAAVDPDGLFQANHAIDAA